LRERSSARARDLPAYRRRRRRCRRSSHLGGAALM